MKFYTFLKFQLCEMPSKKRPASAASATTKLRGDDAAEQHVRRLYSETSSATLYHASGRPLRGRLEKALLRKGDFGGEAFGSASTFAALEVAQAFRFGR